MKIFAFNAFLTSTMASQNPTPASVQLEELRKKRLAAEERRRQEEEKEALEMARLEEEARCEAEKAAEEERRQARKEEKRRQRQLTKEAKAAEEKAEEAEEGRTCWPCQQGGHECLWPQ